MLFGLYELTMKVVGVDIIKVHDKCDEFYCNHMFTCEQGSKYFMFGDLKFQSRMCFVCFTFIYVMQFSFAYGFLGFDLYLVFWVWILT
jgi:hypothetical protein